MNGQWLDNLSHCSEVKVLGEGSFGRVGKFNSKDNYKGGSRILKWGVNFWNYVREIKYYFNIWGIWKKETKKGAQKKGGGGGENSPISPPLDPRLNYPSGIPILSPQNLKFAAFPRRVLREVSLLTVLILFLASIIWKSDFSENYNCICGWVLYKAPQMWIMAIQYYYLLYGGECFTGN